MSTIIDKVTPIVEEIVNDLHAKLVDIEYVKEGKSWFLRVYADKENGIDLDDCALISEQLSLALDQLDPDPFPSAYYLEVSSPGVERPLKTQADMVAAIDQYIHLDYYSPQYKQKFHEGFLRAVDEETYQIEIMDKTRKKLLDIPKKSVAKARLAVKF